MEDVVLKAKEFAKMAHAGQVRKSDPDKPYIIHPLAVANILKEYGFDQYVQAAGVLHDVVEDTKYTLEDILKEFGPDIASLVKGSSEEDKSLSWEERKQHTIDSIKNLDLRHKAVICADKINNLEDLYLLFGSNGKKDFSAFKRGEEQQRWYHDNVYKSIILNEDSNNPMFARYKKAIENVFNNPENNFYRNVIFLEDEEYYDKLKILHAKKQELKRLKDLLEISKPYIIEFSGTPRTGKTTTINNLYDFFKKGGFDVSIIEEFTTSKRYKEELKDQLAKFDITKRNLKIAEYVNEELQNIAKSNKDVVLIDRSLNDRQIWNYRRYKSHEMPEDLYLNARDKYKQVSYELIDYLVITYAAPLISLKRDYLSSLSLEERSFLNEKNISEYNEALDDIRPLLYDCCDGVSIVDTSKMSMNDVSLTICQDVLNDMKKTYLKELHKQFK